MGWRVRRWSGPVRRQLDSRRAPLSVGPATLDVISRRVLVAGFVVHLPVREVTILEVLMRETGRVVSLSELGSAIGTPQAGDEVIARRVRCLARRLAVSPLLAPLIEYAGTAGYRYVCRELPPGEGPQGAVRTHR